MIPLVVPDLSGNERKYADDAVASGFLSHRGRYEPLFEAELGRRFGTPAIATSSGTGALHIALQSLGVGRYDEVIIPNLTFAAPASAVLALGATPVLVDVDPHTWCLDLNKALDAVTPRTKAIIPVHLYGECAGKYLAKLFQLPVIEDSCEAMGYVEPTGTMTAFSFYGNKVMTTGEGGALLGSVEKAKRFRDGGFDERYFHDTPGLNYRMTNMQAAIGLAQLEHVDDILRKRQRVLDIYQNRLEGRGKWLFVVDTDSPQDLKEFLKQKGIETRPVFYPLHLMPPYRQRGNFDVSLKAWQSGLCLPTGPHIQEEQANYICEKVIEWRSPRLQSWAPRFKPTGLTEQPTPS